MVLASRIAASLQTLLPAVLHWLLTWCLIAGVRLPCRCARQQRMVLLQLQLAGGRVRPAGGRAASGGRVHERRVVVAGGGSDQR